MADNTFMYARNLHKVYRKNAISTPVLKGVDMEVAEGEFLSVVGASGSGKSTLMHLLGALDKPDEGEIYYRDKRIDNLSADKRDHLRNHDFGFIFQFYHLLPELTALENVMIPLMIRSSALSWLGNGSAARKRAITLME
ncbi:MAG: ATP-binding cassette domain-containing protein, partial [Planctomycetes bacterium]|nr:ATP-binding cassette domain-containing protein [Planctomycetota bacterium]